MQPNTSFPTSSCTTNDKQTPESVILPIRWSQPLRWLLMGYKDIGHAPFLSLSHGLFLAFGGFLIAWLAHDRFWLLAGAVSGFLVIAPVLATSLYAMSRAIERQEAVNFQLLLNTWLRWQQQRLNDGANYWCLVRFGLLLALTATAWVLTSAALITLLSPLPIHAPMDFIRYVVLSNEHFLFELWLLLGGLMAAPVFASSVVTIPLLLDRKIGVFCAVLLSWKVVLSHPAAMAFWAFLIMFLSFFGIVLFFLGLIFFMPLLGHASWHAYRDLIDRSSLAERMADSGSI